jgi:hypothetical protein
LTADLSIVNILQNETNSHLNEEWWYEDCIRHQ